MLLFLLQSVKGHFFAPNMCFFFATEESHSVIKLRSTCQTSRETSLVVTTQLFFFTKLQHVHVHALPTMRSVQVGMMELVLKRHGTPGEFVHKRMPSCWISFDDPQ